MYRQPLNAGQAAYSLSGKCSFPIFLHLRLKVALLIICVSFCFVWVCVLVGGGGGVNFTVCDYGSLSNRSEAAQFKKQ